MEKEGYRDVLEMLNTAFPGTDVLTMEEVCRYMRMHRQTLIADKKFPKVKLRGKYAIHKAALARYLC